MKNPLLVIRLSPAIIIASLITILSSGTAKSEIMIPAPPQIDAEAWVLMDAKTGDLIVQHDAHERLPPASLTKMMTSYVVSHEIANGRLKASDRARVSEYAWKTGGWASGSSVMSLLPKTEVEVIDLMRGMIIQSGNDASIVLAEHIAGSESAFADIMNQHAKQLGLTDSHFVNSTGLPAESHLTSAYDMALLGRALIKKFPKHYDIYSEKYFEYDGHRQSNRNSLLWVDDSYDGIKTGHTNAAGYCLVASAKRDGRRLISVVLGAPSERVRTQESKTLLSYGFRYYDTAKVFEKGEVLKKGARIWYGNDSYIDLVAKTDIYATIPRGALDKMVTTTKTQPAIKAPIEKYESLGVAHMRYEGKNIGKVSLVASKKVMESGLFGRIYDALTLFIMELIGSFQGKPS